jgi:tetratricopeptide (TPR) repeat protein
MPFWILALALLQQPPKKVVVDPDAPRTLKDEDAAENVKEYTLDPDKAKKEIDVGDYYMRKGSYNAAAKRFEEATKWQPKNALAYLRFGQALEKKDDPLRAAQAYRKFLELAPNDKQAKEVRKKIEKLEKETEK